MKKRYLSIPTDLADEAWKKYTKYGIGVTRRDKEGISVELEVSYYSPDAEWLTGYKISRQGKNLKVKPLVPGRRYKCRLTAEDKKKLFALFQKIDKTEVLHEPERGPHTLKLMEAA